MKILFFTRLFYPHIGGVEKHVYEVGKRLVMNKHAVVIVSEQHEKNLPKQEVMDGMRIFRIPVTTDSWLKKFVIWKWFFLHLDLIKNADIVHCHDVFFWYLPFRFLFPDKKVFTTFHGYESYPISKKAIVMRKISEVLSRGNICIGEFISKWYGTKPTFVTYGGINTIQNLKSRVKNKQSALFIGRLDEQTGIKTYVETLKLIRKSKPEFKLTIIGDGKFGSQIKEQATLLGWKKNPESYFGLYHFAFVSRYLSMLEAMVVKRLVFAMYDNPLKKDYLTMSPFNKYAIICGSAEILAKRVLYFLDHPQEKKRILDIAYQWAKKQSWEEVVNVYLLLWGNSFSKK